MTRHDQLVVDQEFKSLLVPLSPNERELLEQSLLAHGCLHPLTAWRENGRLLVTDGHHRHEICEQHGIKYGVKEMEFESREAAKLWIRKNQLGRRNLPDDARAMLAALLLPDMAKLALSERGRQARRAVKARHPMKADMSATVVNKSAKNSLAEVSKAARTSERRVKLARRIENKAVAVMGAAGAQKVVDRISQGKLSLARAKRDLSKAERAKKMEAAATIVHPDIEKSLRVASMDDFLAKARNLDAVITDPPYGKEYLGLYGELARLAARALKPDGVLAVMVGQSYLPEILAAITAHIRYRWIMTYLTPGPATAVWGAGAANSQFKPILVFGGAKRIVDDVVRSDAEDKSFHEWGQSESGMMRLVERLTEPGAVVADPFLGAGTTALAAIRLHRRAVGCDIDPEMVEVARTRVAGELRA